MCDHNLKIFGGSYLSFLELVDRLSERTLDGVVIVDDSFQIRLANPIVIHDFAPRDEKGGFLPLSGSNYFKVFFQLDQSQPEGRERAKKLPLYKAIRKGAIRKKPPYSTVTASNKLAYQVEQRVAIVKINGAETRMVLEFWRRMGNPAVFEKDPSYIAI